MVQLASMKNAISNPQEACSLKHTVPHNDTFFFTIRAANAPNITGSGIWKPNLEIHPSQASVGQSIGKEGDKVDNERKAKIKLEILCPQDATPLKGVRV